MGLKTQLAIRFARHGCINRPFYHIVVCTKHKAAKTRPVEQLGTWDPMPNENNEQLVSLNFDRIKHYLANGIKPTKSVAKLLGLSGFLPIHPLTILEAKKFREQMAKAALEKQNKEIDIEQPQET